MTSLADLSRQHSSLDGDYIYHLQRLGAEWGFLADLCFADLMLYVRSNDEKWVVVDQVRPATNQTMFVADYIGTWATNSADLLEKAAATGETLEGEISASGSGDASTRMMAIPVRLEGRVVAVLSK